MRERPIIVSHHKYLERVNEVVGKLPPEKLAWAWQNFLKRIANKTAIGESKGLLLTELEEELKAELEASSPPNPNIRLLLQHENKNSPISVEDIEKNTKELEDYLAGNLTIENSKIFQLISGEKPPKEFPPEETDQILQTLRRSKESAYGLQEYRQLRQRIREKLEKIKDNKEKQKIIARFEGVLQEFKLSVLLSGAEAKNLEESLKTLRFLEQEINYTVDIKQRSEKN